MDVAKICCQLCRGYPDRMAICGGGMRNDCKLWREGALKRSLQKFSVYANVSSGLLGKVYQNYYLLRNIELVIYIKQEAG